MQIPPIQTNSPTFGHSHQLKRLYKKGKIPLVKGFYGDPLTKDTVTLEHLDCISNGGKTKWDNLVLTSANSNQARGNRPIIEVISFKAMGEYLDVFKDKVVGGKQGNEYIADILQKVSELIRSGR